jgi:hypothetical protein
MKLFIDLEETIIDDIFDGNILWDKVKEIEDAFFNHGEISIESVETFSFAIEDFRDFEMMRKVIAQGVSDPFHSWLFNIITPQTFKTSEMKSAFLGAVIGHVESREVWDFIGLCTKERVFDWWAQKTFSDDTIVLIDDTVSTKITKFPLKNLKVMTINVNDLNKVEIEKE